MRQQQIRSCYGSHTQDCSEYCTLIADCVLDSTPGYRRCFYCLRPTIFKKATCELHNLKEKRRGHLTEKRRAVNHQCPACSVQLDVDDKHVHCAACRKKRRLANREKRRRRREKGLCLNCGKPASSSKGKFRKIAKPLYCKRCTKAYKVYEENKKARTTEKRQIIFDVIDDALSKCENNRLTSKELCTILAQKGHSYDSKSLGAFLSYHGYRKAGKISTRGNRKTFNMTNQWTFRSKQVDLYGKEKTSS